MRLYIVDQCCTPLWYPLVALDVSTPQAIDMCDFLSGRLINNWNVGLALTCIVLCVSICTEVFFVVTTSFTTSLAQLTSNAEDGIVGIMAKPLVELPAACKPLALTTAAEATCCDLCCKKKPGDGRKITHLNIILYITKTITIYIYI